nr:reverse transcriptase domain-containing protein [Tanacetum cinerariifolium]
MTQSFERVEEITFLSLAASSRTQGPLVIEAEIGGHMIHRMYVDGGSSIEILYEHCFNWLWPEIKSQMVPATTSLTSFSGKTIWPLGQLRLLVIIGDANHSTRAWMNFMIVRSLPPYNGIIGRPGIRAIQAVPSTVHGMLKFPVEGGIVTIRSTVLIPTECTSVITSSAVSKEERTRPDNLKVALHPDFPDQEVTIEGTLSDKGCTELCSILKKNLEIFAWQPSDITAVSRSVVEHWFNIQEGYSLVRQKKRGQAPERAKAIQAEVQKLVEAGIMREVYYHDWLSNPVMDCYPLSEIDWIVESLCGYPFKCFLDAYKGYHQIQLAEPDEEKTAFHTRQGVYCYTTMPFGLKNASATYQRLMNKAFESQIEGVFLGYVVTLEGIKPCPDKTAAMLQLPSPQTIKEVQSLNGKSTSLNRFLSKSAEKSLPLFKTLKKCIKKSDFHWTIEAEQAFKQLKQHLSELPLLVAPKLREELIIYLSATHGAISAVLMTERGVTQTPIYFISHALQGPELNYIPMKKLVLSLVFAAKRLRRPRTSVKGKILADFLIEMPDENPQAAPAAETQQELWTLFTNGSSCVDGSGTRLLLTNPKRIKFTYALRFQFAASNNEAEYEALIAGLRIAAQMGVKNVHVSVDSKLVANQVLGTYVAKEDNMVKYLDKVKSLVRGFTNFSISQVPRSKNKKADALSKIASTSFAHLSKQVLVEVLKDKSIKEKEVATVVEEDRPTWMTPIVEYLKEGTLSSDKKEARKLRIKARQYELIEGILYRWSFLTPWLRCVGLLQAEYVMREIHEGSCSMHAGQRPQQPLTPITAPWPFYKWGIDIAGLFPEGPCKVKILIVAMDYFTKWIEAKAVATIMGDQSNGLVERANRSLGEGIKARLGEGNKNWVEELPTPGDFVYRSNDASHAIAGWKLGPKWEGPYEVTEVLGDGPYKLQSMDDTILPRT